MESSQEAATSTSTASTAPEPASPSTQDSKLEEEAPVSARRAKAMSIGNAASLFGAPGDDAGSAGLFGASESTSKPSSMVQSPFDAIGEESEEPAAVKQSSTAQINEAASNEVLPSPNDTAAALFGDAGQSPVEWLGAASSSMNTASSSNDASNLFGDVSGQPVQGQVPLLYATGQNATLQYSQDYPGSAQQTYGYQGDQQPYQQQQQQAYGQYAEPAVDNFNQSMYYDPAQQQQYQQTLQAQAHLQQAPAMPNGQSSEPYDQQQQQQQYGNYGYNYASAAGQDQYAAYYAAQQQSQMNQYAQPAYDQAQYAYPPQQPQHQEQQHQTASAYQSTGYLQAQQGYQPSYSAPAASAQTSQMQASQASRSNYAPAYSQTYDPYAPSNDAYASQTQYNPSSSSSGHVKQPSLTSSRTAPNLAASLQAAASSQEAKKDPKLNRSASSFFAELPPMPAKSRPASAVGARGATSSAIPPVPALPHGHAQQQAMPPPPPKAKSPAPSVMQQRPPSRVKSAQPPADYGGWSPSMSSGTLSRPGSRTAQRQGSLASTSSHSGQPAASRSSLDQSRQYVQEPYAQYTQHEASAYSGQANDQSMPYGQQYTQQGVASPPMSSRQSIDSNRSQYGQTYTQAYPYSQASNTTSSQSRPQSRTAGSTYASPPPAHATIPPPARKTASRPMAVRSASTSSSVQAISPKQLSSTLPSAANAGNQLGLTDDQGMDDLTASFNKQRLDEDQPGMIAAEASFKRAMTTPLPASEPDLEPRILSPPHPAFTELQRAASPAGEDKASLSPQPPSVPTLSVSMPSPEVDKKNTPLPSHEGSVETLTTLTNYETPTDMLSEMEETEAELVKAEDEVKMEADDDSETDRKPTRQSLDRASNWQQPYGDAATYEYGSSPYDETHDVYERKPSQSELQNAWQNETQYDSYGHTATDQPTWHYNEQDHRATQPAMYQAPHNGYDDSAQHASSTDPYSGHYGQTGTVHQESSHSYAPHDTGYSKDSYQQVANAYEPYQANALSNTPNYQGMNGETANDRERPRNRPAVPIASFGFNGKLVTFFPSSAAPATASYGMMYEDPSSGSTIKIQKLSEILPTALSGFDSFPGPLFMDTGATSASGKAKKKKDILAWLHARIEESQQERNYLGVSASDTAKAQADQKTVVLQLLKILLENDGKLTGTLQVDQLVQQVLVPHLATSGQNSAFAVAADLGNNNYETSAKSVPQATSRDLDTIQTHLLRGEKREAVQYALNNRLYSHALVIASGTDRALLTEVVQDFLAFELGGELAQGREALKVAYSLLSGGGPAAINEFVAAKQSTTNGLAPGTSAPNQLNEAYGTAVSRAPTPTGRAEYPSNVSAQTLSRWQETAAVIIANRGVGDSQALTALGDVLATNSWHKASHACYLLSPLTSTLGGPSVSGVRWSLLGAQDPLQNSISANDLEAIILTEIVEFAFSLVPVAKGQEAYIGLPHLQAYRVLHACHLADTGHHSQAQKYCDAIGATLKLATKRSPFYHPTLLGQVKDLSDRLSMVSFQDKGGSWISRKVQRPTIDNVWSTLESRFAKFVTGDGEEDAAEEERKRKARDAAKGVAGPFAHYSSITPQGPEGLSRNGSYADLTMRATPPPQPTSVPNTVSNANTTKATHHRRSSSYTYGPYGADPYGSYVPQMPQTAEEPEQASQNQSSEPQANERQEGGYNEPQYGYVTPQNDSGWWSTGNGGQESSPYGSSSSYGQAPTFSPVTEGYGITESQGLMSPMGFSHSPNMTSQNFQPQPSKLQQEVSTASYMDDDEDDLGLGNSSTKRRKAKEAEATGTTGSADGGHDEDKKPETAKKEEPAKPAATTSGSWLGRIFRREGSASPTTGPIRAKLGEETSFVYDPVEKRWVNKKAGSDTPPPAATPPPPRAQTASPAGYSQPSAPVQSGATPPPPSARSASSTPVNPPPPTRSSVPPPAGASTSLPTPPPPGPPSAGSRPPSRATSVPTGELPPPPARKPGAGSAAAKKARSRYVDVFAQEQK